jgi:hypothetical protein
MVSHVHNRVQFGIWRLTLESTPSHSMSFHMTELLTVRYCVVSHKTTVCGTRLNRLLEVLYGDRYKHKQTQECWKQRTTKQRYRTTVQRVCGITRLNMYCSICYACNTESVRYNDPKCSMERSMERASVRYRKTKRNLVQKLCGIARLHM